MRMQDLPRDIAQLMCHASPLAWANYAMGEFVVPYPHLKYVESKLVRVGEDIKRLRISQPPQSGKLCADSTPVFTPDGMRPHGDLKVGDSVWGMDGSPKKVLATSEKTLATLLVRTTDGAEIKCHPEHEWLMYDRRLKIDLVIETRLILERLKGDSTLARWMFPMGEYPRGNNPRWIDSITPCDPELGNCIQVEDGVYFVTKNIVPTHNSLLVSTSFPTWYLGRHPDARLMIVSYGGKRAHDLGQQTKDMFANHAGPIFGLECDPSARSKEFWKVKGRRGYLMSAGIGGPVNGFPADLIIFDDPYASAEDALSPAGRKTVERFVTSVLAARLQRNGSMLFVSTRWHPDDVIGWSKKQERSGGYPWNEVVLQALPEVDRHDEETGELIQKADESICEELKPKEFLLEMKAACSHYEWMSLWMQTPVAAAGSLWESNMFGSDQFIEDWPHDLDALVLAIDPAMGSELADGDYSAIVALGVRGDGLFYTEADIEITGPEDTITRLISFVDRLPKLPDLIGIESVGFAKLVKDIGAARLVENNILVPVVAMKPTMKHVSTGKEVTIRKQDRISMVLDTFIREQLVRYVRSRGTTRLVHQLENFPIKKYHDDGPDALEMCFRLLRDVGQTRDELSRIAAR